MRGGRDEEDQEPPSVVTTWRLMLRCPDKRDHLAISALSRSPRIAENVTAAPAPAPGEPGERFAVFVSAGAELIGAAAYGPVPDRAGSIEISVCVGERHWGQGYGTETTQALIDRAFADDRISRLWCSNRVTNARARRVVEKCGFQFRETGMVRSPHDFGAMPVERFVLDRRNWISLKSWGAPQGGGRRDRSRETAA